MNIDKSCIADSHFWYGFDSSQVPLLNVFIFDSSYSFILLDCINICNNSV